MSIMDADIDFDGTTDTITTRVPSDFDSWMREMLEGEVDETTSYDDEDADWHENIFVGEEDEDEDEEVDERTEAIYRAIFETPATPAEEPQAVAAKPRDPKKCREWARVNGFNIGNRGVIASEVWDAYFAS